MVTMPVVHLDEASAVGGSHSGPLCHCVGRTVVLTADEAEVTCIRCKDVVDRATNRENAKRARWPQQRT